MIPRIRIVPENQLAEHSKVDIGRLKLNDGVSSSMPHPSATKRKQGDDAADTVKKKQRFTTDDREMNTYSEHRQSSKQDVCSMPILLFNSDNMDLDTDSDSSNLDHEANVHAINPSQSVPTSPSDTGANQTMWSQAMFPPLTTDAIVEPTDNGPSRTKKAMKGRSMKRLVATIPRYNVDSVLYNDRDVHMSHGTPVFRRNNMQDLLTYAPDIRSFVEESSCNDILNQTDCRSLWYLSYLMHPEKWQADVSLNSDDATAQGQHDFLDYSKSNTRTVEQNTTYPDITAEGVSCVVIGDPNIIATTLNSNLSFSDACDRTYRTIFNLTRDQPLVAVEKNIRQSNDFPVLGAGEFEDMIHLPHGGICMANFAKKTGERDAATYPLLLTSCTEAMMRVQQFYIDKLYRCHTVKLDPVPVDTSGVFYKLSDSDRISQIMNFVKSDSILFHVYVVCESCGQSHTHLWKPNDEESVTEVAKSHTCERCGKCGTVMNMSHFVLRESKCRHSLDAASSRKISYDIATRRVKEDGTNKKKTTYILPSGISSVDQLQQYERVWPISSKIKLAMEEDVGCKNQRTTSVSVTLFIPTTFSNEKTMESVKHMLEGSGMVLNREVSPRKEHLIHARIFHEGREHMIDLVATRVKLSLTCNKVVEADVSMEHGNRFSQDMARFKKSVTLIPNFEAGCLKLKMCVPSTQTNKRIGVMTVRENGQAIIHTSNVLLTHAKRDKGKRQKPAQFQENGTMYRATNFWCHPDWDQRDNFLQNGLSLVAGLVHNFFQQGTCVVNGGHEVCLIDHHQYKWADLDTLYGWLTKENAETLLKKSSKKTDVSEIELLLKEEEVRLLRKKIEKQEKVIEKQKGEDAGACSLTEYDEPSNIEALKKRLTDLGKCLQQVTEERDNLLIENENLKDEVQVLKCSIDRMTGECNTLNKRIDAADDERRAISHVLNSVREDNENLIREQTEMKQKMENFMKGFLDFPDVDDTSCALSIEQLVAF